MRPVKAFKAIKLSVPTDARTLTISNDMRVGLRVFRAGSPVSDVLEAATAAYRAQPLPLENAAPKALSDTAVFLETVRQMLSTATPRYFRPDNGMPINLNNKALWELMEAFNARTVADVDPDDRDQFEKRLREELGL